MPIYIISLIILFAIAFFIQLDNQTIISYIESLQKEKISTEEFKNKAAIDILLNNAQASLNSLQLIEPAQLSSSTRFDGHRCHAMLVVFLFLKAGDRKQLGVQSHDFEG